MKHKSFDNFINKLFNQKSNTYVFKIKIFYKK
jgi:hypothetical protein